MLGVLLLYSLLVGAPIVHQVEAEVGREITCDEAYFEHREIDSYLFANHRTPGHVIYMSNMCFPVWLIFIGLFTAVTGAVSWFRERRIRLYWPLVFATLVTLIPIVLQSRLIYIIACATE
jgi:hypothetical protein